MLWAPRPCADSGLGFVLCGCSPKQVASGPSSALMLQTAWMSPAALPSSCHSHSLWTPKRQLSVCTTPGELCLSLVLRVSRRKILCWTHWVEFAWKMAGLATLLGHCLDSWGSWLRLGSAPHQSPRTFSNLVDGNPLVCSPPTRLMASC